VRPTLHKRERKLYPERGGRKAKKASAQASNINPLLQGRERGRHHRSLNDKEMEGSRDLGILKKEAWRRFSPGRVEQKGGLRSL